MLAAGMPPPVIALMRALMSVSSPGASTLHTTPSRAPRRGASLAPLSRKSQRPNSMMPSNRVRKKIAISANSTAATPRWARRLARWKKGLRVSFTAVASVRARRHGDADRAEGDVRHHPGHHGEEAVTGVPGADGHRHQAGGALAGQHIGMG